MAARGFGHGLRGAFGDDVSAAGGPATRHHGVRTHADAVQCGVTASFWSACAGGETGGNADTGDVWAASQVVNNVEFAANFYSDEGVTAKSGAEVDTWATGSQLSTGDLDLAIVENYTS